MRNEYEVQGDITRIFLAGLGGGYTTLIDTRMLEKVRQIGDFRWYAKNEGQHAPFVYAVANTSRQDSPRKSFRLHRVIVDAPRGLVVDHLNHDGLDNRLCNLRITTVQGNSQNLLPRGASGRRGVTWHKDAGKWQASVKTGGRNYYVGLFDDLDEAAAAAAAKRRQVQPFAIEESA